MKMRKISVALLTGLALVIAMTATPRPAAASVVCGQTLGPGGVFVLDANLGPCAGPDFAVKLLDGARLDLRGFDISCTSTSVVGIQISGDNTLVRSTQAGVEAPAQMIGCKGVDITGDGNRVSDLQVSGGGNLSAVGLKNQFVRNKVTGDGAGSPGTAIDFKGDRGLLYANEVELSGDGIVVDGNFNSVNSNNAHDNTGEGIFISSGKGNIVVLNTASNNDSGIEVDGTMTRIEHNTALNNTAVDLSDLNPNCDQNIWKGNTFTTRNQPCIN
jgi:parallel beta-helix repeat protein